MDIKDDMESMLKDAKEYLDTSQQLFKLQLIEKTAKIIAVVIAVFIVFTIFTIAFLFVSVALAHVFAELLHHEFAGYLMVTFIYLFFGVVLVRYAGKLLIKPIMNKIIKQILGNE